MKTKNVFFNTYPMAFDVPGGGEMQLLSSIRELSRLGISASLFDQWNPQFETCACMHYFSAMSGALPFCDYVRSKGIPLFVSPNLWLTEETVRLYPMGEVRALLNLADRVVCNSSMEASRFQRLLQIPEHKLLTVHCGIDDVYTEPRDETIFREKFGQDKFVLSIGTIENRKNQLALIRAMRQFPEYKLVLIGYTRDKAYVERCQKEGGEQVVYMGSFPQGDPMLRSAMSACELFVGPGIMETPGGANLEAAAMGAPLVVTSVGSTREYFEDYATYLEPDSETTIAAAIRKGLEAGRSDALQKHVRDNFTWKKVLQPLVDAYSALSPNM